MSKSRNAKCSCGSGKKYKLCHGARVEKERKRTSSVTVTLAMIAIAAFILVGVFTAWSSNGPAEAGDGRVWSAEHGHWHDSSGREPAGPSSGAASNGPGPGKTWSPEHNHWH